MINILNPKYWSKKHPTFWKNIKIINVIFKVLFYTVSSLGWIAMIAAAWPYMSIRDVLSILWFLLSCLAVSAPIRRMLRHIELAWKHSISNNHWQQLAYHISCITVSICIIVGFFIGLLEVMHIILITGEHIVILKRLNIIYTIMAKHIIDWF